MALAPAEKSASGEVDPEIARSKCHGDLDQRLDRLWGMVVRRRCALAMPLLIFFVAASVRADRNRKSRMQAEGRARKRGFGRRSRTGRIHQQWKFSFGRSSETLPNNHVFTAMIVVSPFRSLASSASNEHGFNRDWIEMQLAHVPNDGVRAAYNTAECLVG
jgi:hypothetical protein